MDIASQIKSTLSMADVALRYGHLPNSSGFIHCPFHDERTPSLKIYSEPGRGFHCFGCHASGSVIDFAMLLFNIPFSAAVVRLNADFNLGLTGGRPDPRDVMRMRRERDEAERKRAEYEADYWKRTDEHLRLWSAKLAGPDDPDYAEAVKRLDALEEWFEENPYIKR